MNNKITCKRIRPNPVFEDWIAQMYEDAKLNKSNLEGMLKEALESLLKYPLPLKSGAECIILKGFNKTLCEYIDKLLNWDNNNKTIELKTTAKPNPECYVEIQHIKVDKIQDYATTPSVGTKNTGNGMPKGKKEEKKANVYKPAYRSGGYAILIALLEQSLENPNKCALSKEELIEKAQKHAEESLVRRKHDSYYNGWSSMSTLQKKGLVSNKKGKKAEYTLTEEGKEVAKQILEDAKSIPAVNDIIFKDMPIASTASDRQNIVFVDDNIPSTSGNIDYGNVVNMEPGTFHIILLIDKNETSGYVFCLFIIISVLAH